MSFVDEILAKQKRQQELGGSMKFAENTTGELNPIDTYNLIKDFDYSSGKFTIQEMAIIKKNLNTVMNVLDESKAAFIEESLNNPTTLNESFWSRLKDAYWYKAWKGVKTQYEGKIKYITENLDDDAMKKSLNNFLTTYLKYRTAADKRNDTIKKIASVAIMNVAAVVGAGIGAAATGGAIAVVPLFAMMTGISIFGAVSAEEVGEIQLLKRFVNKIDGTFKFTAKGMEIKQSDGKYKTYIQLEYEALDVIDKIYHDAHDNFHEKHKLEDWRKDIERLTKSMDFTAKEIDKIIERMKKMKELPGSNKGKKA